MQQLHNEFITLDKNSVNILESMLKAQQRDGYLSKSAIRNIADKYGMRPSMVYETASFYSMIKLQPEGKVAVEICRSAPCHVTGAREVITAVENHLGVKTGETSSDGKFSIKCVECLGNCQSGPALMINGILHEHVSPDDVYSLLEKAADL